jgi:hypothetical protein
MKIKDKNILLALLFVCFLVFLTIYLLKYVKKQKAAKQLVDLSYNSDTYLDNNTYNNSFKNNNPANIRFTLPPFNGQNLFPVNGFCDFSDVRYGIRACGINLNSYFNDNINTLSNIVNTYAPSNENNTQDYLDNLLNHLNSNGYMLSVTQDLTNYHMDKNFDILLIQGIIINENSVKVDSNFIGYCCYKFN